MGGWVVRVPGRRVERGRIHGGRKKETCGRSLRARRRRKAEAERAGVTCTLDPSGGGGDAGEGGRMNAVDG